MIRLNNITKVHRTHDVETRALSDVSIEIASGEFVAVMGPSGCGKSTLLNVIGMIDPPSSGEYLFEDEDVSKYSERDLAALRRRNVGFVFQSFNLLDELTVYENVELPLAYQRVPRDERKERVSAVLDLVGLAGRAKHKPTQLSGGQQQRVAIARAIVSDPKLIVADEPTGNLDTQNGDDVMDMLAALNRQGTTIMMVTHSAAHARHANRTVNFLNGRVVSTASAAP